MPMKKRRFRRGKPLAVIVHGTKQNFSHLFSLTLELIADFGLVDANFLS